MTGLVFLFQSSEESDESLIIKLKNKQTKLREAIESCSGARDDINCSDFDEKKYFQILKDDSLTNVVPRTIDIEELTR